MTSIDYSERRCRDNALVPEHTRITVTHYGGPEALKVIHEKIPEPRPGEVRVRVLAAGVSLPDVMMREGIHPETPALPFTPGWDLVGVVDRIGEGVTGIEPGQIVAALPIHGAYSEFVCLPPEEFVPVPAGLDAGEAVALVLNCNSARTWRHCSILLSRRRSSRSSRGDSRWPKHGARMICSQPAA
jgi:NADPH2:quinone reductase